MEYLLEHMGKGFVTMLMIAMPVVLTAAGIGLIVGVLQAVTQVQEQTIAAAPKILGVFLIIIFLGGFFTKLLMDYTYEASNLAFNVVTKQGRFALSEEEIQEQKFIEEEKRYNGLKSPKIEKIMKNPGKVPYQETE